jgi:hypothetical protein
MPRLARARRPGLLVALLISSCGSASGTEPQRVTPSTPSPWTPAPDIVAFARLWNGDPSGCGNEVESRPRPGASSSFERTCSVAGWTAVILARSASDPAVRSLSARNDVLDACAAQRFAGELDVIRNMQSNIVSTVVVSLHTGPFAGSCLTAQALWTQGGCVIQVSTAWPEREPSPMGCPR